MNTLTLHPVYHPKDPARRYKGIAIVIGLHIIIGYGIVSGTAVNGLKKIHERMTTEVLVDVVVPPPPPLPKPPTPIQKSISEALPPPVVQRPDDATPEINPNAIETSAEPTTAPIQIKQPEQVVQSTPKANTSDLRVACPTQASPEMPRKAIQDGAEGVVRASALIRDGVIRDITILSGPRVFHAAVKAAMLQYKCTASAGEVVATQEFVFKLE